MSCCARRYNSLIESFPSGRYFMGGTELPFTPNTGNSFASFLLGSVASAQFTRAQGWWAPRWYSNSFYFQDDWKPMRNLTLNLGLRWMYETPFNTTGLISQFDPTVKDSAHRKNGRNRSQSRGAGEKGSEQLSASARAGLELPAQMGVPRKLRPDYIGSADEHAEQQL